MKSTEPDKAERLELSSLRLCMNSLGEFRVVRKFNSTGFEFADFKVVLM